MAKQLKDVQFSEVLQNDDVQISQSNSCACEMRRSVNLPPPEYAGLAVYEFIHDRRPVGQSEHQE